MTFSVLDVFSPKNLIRCFSGRYLDQLILEKALEVMPGPAEPKIAGPALNVIFRHRSLLVLSEPCVLCLLATEHSTGLEQLAQPLVWPGIKKL